MNFGGSWTEEKLNRLKKYLPAYTTILGKRKYKFAYIDAFAGTGYRLVKQEESLSLFEDFSNKATRDFLDGSARIALQTEPKFQKFIFLEKDPERFKDLEKLKKEFPTLAERIILENVEANTYIQQLCKKDWSKHRALLFLDPYGMQVEWSTIEAVSRTKAIDLWILFPLGVAVNRLLKKDGSSISPTIKTRLTSFFGSDDWFEVFYKNEGQENLFGEENFLKQADFQTISEYFVRRLKTLFPCVSENPLPLFNSTNNPLYLLCFAAENRTAVKIAEHILKG